MPEIISYVVGLKGRIERNKILEKLMPLLWHGLTDRAVFYLKETDKTIIKDQSAMDRLVAYLAPERK